MLPGVDLLCWFWGGEGGPCRWVQVGPREGSAGTPDPGLSPAQDTVETTGLLARRVMRKAPWVGWGRRWRPQASGHLEFARSLSDDPPFLGKRP